MLKSVTFRYLLGLGFLAFALTSCLEDQCEESRTYMQFTPVFKRAEEFRLKVAADLPRTLEQPGKIYFYQQYLLINEPDKGIHIFDNFDPRNPQNLAFIEIPGNVDMAVKGDILYADNYTDLLAISIEDPLNPVLRSRTEDVFPAVLFDQEKGFLMYYEETEVTEKIPCSEAPGDIWLRGDFVFVAPGALTNFYDSANGNIRGSQAATATGIGGSLARFTVMGDYLYTVDHTNLRVFDIHQLTDPKLANTVGVGWGIETIFPYEDKLFLGSNSGMFIFDNSNPVQPAMLSVFQHATACDPVFVDGDIAYVTLRGGTPCQGFNNQLDVIDVSDLTRPKLLATYPMYHPIGLSVVNNTLYLCEDDQGLKVFDVSDWRTIDRRQLDHEKGFTAYDVIALKDYPLAMVIGKDGLYQFDISDPADLKRLSIIRVAD